MKGTHKQIRKVIILLFWLGIWQAAALLADNPILLAGPFQVLRAFVDNLMRPDFIFIVLHSLAGIGLGFFLALFAGMLLGAAGYRMTWAEELLAPMIAVFKSVPVASFVVLLLIWFGSGRLSFWISFLTLIGYRRIVPMQSRNIGIRVWFNRGDRQDIHICWGLRI